MQEALRKGLTKRGRLVKQRFQELLPDIEELTAKCRSGFNSRIYLLHKLATRHGNDDEVTRTLDTRAFSVTPLI